MTDRAALVHEWLESRAGSETTFLRMAAVLPRADVFALTCTPELRSALARPVRTTFLDRPLTRGRRAATLGLMPVAWKSLRDREYTHVVSSSHAFSRAFVNPGVKVHLSYTYTPARYIWYPELDRRSTNWTARAARPLRHLDRRVARTVTSFAAISAAVQQRISECYDSESELIYPPVDTEFFHPRDGACSSVAQRRYVLSVGRLIGYKRHDLAIRVARALDLPLVIAGYGPLEAELRTLAEEVHPGRVSFVIAPAIDAVRDLYRDAIFTSFPVVEDFGIVPVESQACGTPVLGVRAGGVCETVVDGSTGVLSATQEESDVVEAARRLGGAAVDYPACVRNAQRFSAQRFDAELADWFERHEISVPRTGLLRV